MKKKDFEAFQSNYLGKVDLEAGPLSLVIKHVEEGEVSSDGGKEKKPVLFARNQEKGLILNNTNWDAIEAAYGEDSDDWTGQRIEVYYDPSIQFGGKKVGGVRVRPLQTAQRPQVQQSMASELRQRSQADQAGAKEGFANLPDADPNAEQPPF